MQLILNILITLLVFGLLILAHEAGHFFVAKACKVKVNEFSIGMGPAVFKKQGKNTLYSIRLLPIGGFVQMDGEDGDGTDKNSFNKKPYWQRFLVLVMGALMNILFGFILICIIKSQTLIDTTIVAKFDDNAVSSSSGLSIGDEIIEVEGYKINSFYDFNYAILKSGTDPIDIKVKRGDERILIEDVTFPIAEDEKIGKYFEMDFFVLGKKPTFFGTVKNSFDWTVSISKSIYSVLGDLFTFKADINQVSGPVGTTEAIGESAKLGLDAILLIVALISINLGIVNLLPFPALDGGRIVLLGLEAVRKKPLNQKVEYAINAVGLIILFGFMILITVKDVLNLF